MGAFQVRSNFHRHPLGSVIDAFLCSGLLRTRLSIPSRCSGMLHYLPVLLRRALVHSHEPASVFSLKPPSHMQLASQVQAPASLPPSPCMAPAFHRLINGPSYASSCIPRHTAAWLCSSTDQGRPCAGSHHPSAPPCHAAGSLHVPLEQLPHALQSPMQEFQEAYGQQQPLRGHGWLVLCSRREGRAAWAAQVAHDAGFRFCLILRQVPPARPPAVRERPSHAVAQAGVPRCPAGSHDC